MKAVLYWPYFLCSAFVAFWRQIHTSCISWCWVVINLLPDTRFISLHYIRWIEPTPMICFYGIGELTLAHPRVEVRDLILLEKWRSWIASCSVYIVIMTAPYISYSRYRTSLFRWHCKFSSVSYASHRMHHFYPFKTARVYSSRTENILPRSGNIPFCTWLVVQFHESDQNRNFFGTFNAFQEILSLKHWRRPWFTLLRISGNGKIAL